MTPLREKMIKDMKVRRLSIRTQETYIRAVFGLAKFYMKSPDELTEKQVQDYLFYLLEDRKLSWSSCNVITSAVCFFYHTTLSNHNIKINIPPRKQQSKLPEVLSVEELEKLFNAISNFKHKVMLMTAYSAGLRTSELVNLKPTHIDSKRMLIRIEQSKGNKDRYTLLSNNLLIKLKEYQQRYQPNEWLFPIRYRKSEKQMNSRNPWRIYEANRRKAGIKKGGGIHILRHSFATHLLESGVDIRIIQQLLGHKFINTTSVYLKIAHQNFNTLKSPFDIIDFPNNRSDK